MASITEMNQLDDMLDKNMNINKDAAAAPEEQDKQPGDDVSSDEGGNAEGGMNVQVISRNEKKARKALSKLGLKKVEGINRVTMRRPKGVLLVVSKPEVYKSDNCYIVFGEAKVEDQSGLIAAHQQQQFLQNQMAAQAAEKQHALASKSSEKQKEGGDADEAEGEEEDDGDETGLKDSDIELVMGQANCSRAKAVKALKQGGGDLVNSIMAAS